jgi:hypothetical protein
MRIRLSRTCNGLFCPPRVVDSVLSMHLDFSHTVADSVRYFSSSVAVNLIFFLLSRLRELDLWQDDAQYASKGFWL